MQTSTTLFVTTNQRSKYSTSDHHDKNKWRHCNLVSILQHIWKNMSCYPNPVHVYRHQDKEPGERTPLEKINIHMDQKARACAQIFKPIQSHGVHWNTKGFGLVNKDGTMVGGAFKKTLYSYIGHHQYVTYLSNKWNHNEEIMKHQVAWPLFAKACKATRHHLRIFISKWMVGHLPTRAVMKKWKQRVHA